MKEADATLKDFAEAVGQYRDALIALRSKQQEVAVFATLRDIGVSGAGLSRPRPRSPRSTAHGASGEGMLVVARLPGRAGPGCSTTLDNSASVYPVGSG